MNSQSDFLLASASPRRRELLQQIGTHFSITPVDIPEHRLAGEPPSDYVLRLAEAKARVGFERQSDAAESGKLPVLGSDTAVVLGDQIFGKPANRDDAVTMLMSLSGQSHRVLTAVAMVNNEQSVVRFVETLVHFRHLNKEECLRYWATGEPADKAGGYGIQGLGAVFVDRIEGSYSNVVGLPLTETCEILQAFNISYWKK